jgi:beta-lactamase regulating signal transducer with metallopeptidase domain
MNSTPLLELLSHTAMKGVAVLALALFAGLALRNLAASRRYAVWITTIVALGLLPLAMSLLPAWRVLPQAAVASLTAGTTADESGAVLAAGMASLPWIWLTVTSLLLFRLLWSAGRLHRLRRTLKQVDCETVVEVGRELGLKRLPLVLIGAADAVPMVWGVWSTCLLLPRGFESWSAEKLRGVLLHELSHLKRRDPLALWAAQCVKALHWFNPLAWLTIRQLRADQERACDDMVLRQGVRASAYAQYLLDLSRETRAASDLTLFAPTITRCAPVEVRVKAILDPKLHRDGISARWLVILAGLALLTILPLAMLHAIEDKKMATEAPKVEETHSPVPVPTATPASQNPAPRRRQLISSPSPARGVPQTAPRRRTLIEPEMTRIEQLLEQAAIREPLGKALRPAGGSGGSGFGLVAETVTRVGEDVHLGLHAGGFVFEVERGHAFGDVRAVAVTGGDEQRRHAFLSGKETRSAGIDEALEVRAAGLALDRVGGVFLAGIVRHSGKSGEFATGGETEDAQAVAFQMPFGSAAANEADGAARVGHGMILNGVGAALFASQSVFQDEGGDTAITEPFGQRVAFMAEAEFGMTAAGADDDRRAGGFVISGNEGSDRGVVNVADVAAFDLLGFGDAGFGAGRTVGPERDGCGQVRGERDHGGENCNESGKKRFHEVASLAEGRTRCEHDSPPCRRTIC